MNRTRRTILTVTILLLSTTLLTALPAATAGAPNQDGEAEEGLECADGSQAEEIVDGLGTCDLDGDGQPDQVVGHVPVPGIGAVDASANQVLVSSPSTGFVEFFSVTAETTEDSPVGENTVRVGATCFMGNTDDGECRWIWIGSTPPFQPDQNTVESGESSILGEREASAGVGNAPVLATASCACVWITHIPTADYEDEDRSLHAERTSATQHWYTVDYEEDDLGEIHLAGGQFNFLIITLTSLEATAETDEDSPFGANDAHVFYSCIGVSPLGLLPVVPPIPNLPIPVYNIPGVPGCVANAATLDASIGEDTPLGEQSVESFGLVCLPSLDLGGIVVVCRGGATADVPISVKSEQAGEQELFIRHHAEEGLTLCAEGDQVDEGCQTIGSPPE